MVDTKAETWKRGVPSIDGYYWMRLDPKDDNPMPVRWEKLNLHEIGVDGDLRRYMDIHAAEFLGPITPSDSEQLVRLREVAEHVLTYLDRESGRQYPFNKEPQNIAAALRNALGTQRED